MANPKQSFRQEFDEIHYFWRQYIVLAPIATPAATKQSVAIQTPLPISIGAVIKLKFGLLMS